MVYYILSLVTRTGLGAFTARLNRVNFVARSETPNPAILESAAPKPRVSRTEAVQRFLNATIALLDEKPIVDISLQEISERAGLNHGYVYRYFGTRLDLFTAVTDELAHLSLEAARQEIHQRHESTTGFGPIDLAALSPSWSLALSRIRVVQYLVSCGVDASRFAEKSRVFITQIEEQLRDSGITERLARTLAVRAGVLFWAQASLLDLLGITAGEQQDVLTLNLDQFVNHAATADRLGWVSSTHVTP